MSSVVENPATGYIYLPAVKAEIKACGSNIQSADVLKVLEKHYEGNSRYPEPQAVEMQLIVYLLAEHKLYEIITDLIKFTQRPASTGSWSGVFSDNDSPLHPAIATPVIGTLAALANQISTASYSKTIETNKKLLEGMVDAVKQSPSLARALEESVQLNEHLQEVLNTAKPKQFMQSRYSSPAPF